MSKSSKAIHFLILWTLLWVLYLVFAGAGDLQEMAAGALVSAAASLLSLRSRSTSEERFIPRLRWFAPFLKVPGTVLAESWLLLTALVRRICRPSDFKGGSFIDRELPPVPPDEATARFAVTVIGVCLTPNDYIVSIDPDRRVARIRILVGRELSGADRGFLELT